MKQPFVVGIRDGVKTPEVPDVVRREFMLQRSFENVAVIPAERFQVCGDGFIKCHICDGVDRAAAGDDLDGVPCIAGFEAVKNLQLTTSKRKHNAPYAIGLLSRVKGVRLGRSIPAPLVKRQPVIPDVPGSDN